MDKILTSALQEMASAMKGAHVIEFDPYSKKYSKVQTVSAGVVSKGPAAGTRQDIVAGGTASGGAVPSGALQRVETGGAASGAAVKAGGVQYVASQGTAAAAHVASGGMQCISGGAAFKTVLNAGAVQIVSKGTATAAIVSAGACQQVAGKASGARIASGGTQFINDGGGSAFNTVVSAGGLQIVSQGSAFKTDVYGTQMLDRGCASSVVVRKGGRQIADRGAVVESARIEKGAAQLLHLARISGAAVFGSQTAEESEMYNVRIESGGRQTLEACKVYGGTVMAGGMQIVRNVVGRLNSVAIASGGVQQISASKDGIGVLNSITISGGGVQKIKTAGSAQIYIESTTVKAGGVQNVVAGGRHADVRGTILAGSQTLQMQSGRIAGTKIQSGGIQKSIGAGEILGTVIEAGGRQEISGCECVEDVAIGSGGLLKALNCSRMDGIEVSAGGSAVFASCLEIDEMRTAGTASFRQGGKIRRVEALSQGTAKMLSGTVTDLAIVRKGGTMKLASGAEVHNLVLQKGGVFSGGGMVLKGGDETAEEFLYEGANVRIDSCGLTFKNANAGTRLAYLKTDKSVSVNFSIENAAPKSAYLLTVNASNAHLGGTVFAASMSLRQQAGTYRLEKGLAMPSGARWTVNVGGDAVKAELNGSAASIHGRSCRIVSSGGAVTLQTSLQAGGMLRGTAKGETLSGTKQCDAFWGGAGNDVIKGVDGNDVAIYGKGKWGQDVIEATKGCMTVIFKDVKKSEIETKFAAGGALVLTRKSDPAQSVTVKDWKNENMIVYGSVGGALSKWCAGTSLTAAELKTARTEAWQAAALA